MNGHGRISPAIGDETIELHLTAEQLLELARAAELAEPVAPAPISAVAAPAPTRRVRPWYLTPFAKMAGATIGYVVLAWWSAAQLQWRPESTATAAVTLPVVIPRPALSTNPPDPAVRVINPFDASEVFEFPARTSLAEGRAQVAQKLLQRARERQSQWQHIRPAARLRTASLYRDR